MAPLYSAGETPIDGIDHHYIAEGIRTAGHPAVTSIESPRDLAPLLRRTLRPGDTVGFAGLVNGISSSHQTFLKAGGLGILVGDGMLPNPGPEQIIEAYYSLPVSFWRVTFDYQYIVNPAYNRDRGPVSVIGTRLHAQF